MSTEVTLESHMHLIYILVKQSTSLKYTWSHCVLGNPIVKLIPMKTISSHTPAVDKFGIMYTVFLNDISIDINRSHLDAHPIPRHIQTLIVVTPSEYDSVRFSRCIESVLTIKLMSWIGLMTPR